MKKILILVFLFLTLTAIAEKPILIKGFAMEDGIDLVEFQVVDTEYDGVWYLYKNGHHIGLNVSLKKEGDNYSVHYRGGRIGTLIKNKSIYNYIKNK